MNCPGPNSATADPAAEVDPVVVAHPADEVDPVVAAHPADGADPVVVPHPADGADGADPAADPELPERVVVAVPADDLVSQARRDSSDVKLGIPRT